MSYVKTPDQNIEFLIRDLPDQKGARLFLDRLKQEQPRSLQKLQRDQGLFSDALALAAWSPLLATTLEQNPDYISWLMRERSDTRVRTREQLKESLARFAMTNSSLGPQVMLARFRRRELLRTYLHDVRKAHSVVETTEELSNLADAILDYALSLTRQELENRYGPPLRDDERGRVAPAEFCIIALGKLGSYELNYASDIDLVFIYSDDGMTSGSGERGKISNREYFIKLAENITKLVGKPSGEGAAYRVDLRLRPHGRDGTLACSLDEALRYYANTAQAWERQTLIRSRAAAGSSALFARFAAGVEEHVYRPDVSINEALESVRLAKQKIDRHIKQGNHGFNVKLQRGGIREIEFIAQALQIAHGGRDEWLRVPHTLISLGRLADRDLITEQERTELSDAYSFLRMLEHRLQMEHGLQTHIVPDASEARTLVARRVGFLNEDAVKNFDSTLRLHSNRVIRAFDRVFAEVTSSVGVDAGTESLVSLNESSALREEVRAMQAAAKIFWPDLETGDDAEIRPANVKALGAILTAAALESLNPHRAIMLSALVAASLDKSETRVSLDVGKLKAMVRLCGASELFGEMLASHPALIGLLGADSSRLRRRDYRALLRAAVDPERSFPAELAAFRKEWSGLLIEIGAADAAETISLAESNFLQSELAIASINVAFLIARREMVRRYGRMDGGPRLSILALGRLASGGVDYGSDLDIIIVYDSLVSSPVSTLSPDEANARLAELMISALSSVTRDGYLYRVDLRLRPNGKNGPLVTSSEAFLDYLKQRSAIWEWLAYVKLRAVAGDLELGRMIETHARHAIHEKAQLTEDTELRREARRVRELLEKEKSVRGRQPGKRRDLDIKYGAGGMLDVYFATRYLQLRDDVSDEGDDRSTSATLERLDANGSLAPADYTALSEGYTLLRNVDHQLRFIAGKVARLPSASHPLLAEIARRLEFDSARELSATLTERMEMIRKAYERITAESTAG
jgi:[glutamine synthetase] adenylyltransferase / [glutamine synthetase]-adenylyl-L-tyrosine phosphorylase